MKRMILLFVVLLTINSCNRQGNKTMQKQFNIERHFTVEDVSDIGVLRIHRDITLYEKPYDSTKFAIIQRDEKQPMLHFSPKELENFFNPLYFDYSGSYGMNSNYDTYVIRDWTFRVASMNNDWIKIVFDEKGHRTCYLKTKEVPPREYFRTWEHYFNGEERPAFITISNQPLYDTINGNAILPDKDTGFHFRSDKVQGDWMHITEHRFDEKKLGRWIKWRNGSKILINYRETWGLE